MCSWLVIMTPKFHKFQFRPSEKAERRSKAVDPPDSDFIYICCSLSSTPAAKVCDDGVFPAVSLNPLHASFLLLTCTPALLTRRCSTSLQMFYSPDKNNRFLLADLAFTLCICVCVCAGLPLRKEPHVEPGD